MCENIITHTNREYSFSILSNSIVSRIVYLIMVNISCVLQ